MPSLASGRRPRISANVDATTDLYFPSPSINLVISDVYNTDIVSEICSCSSTELMVEVVGVLGGVPYLESFNMGTKSNAERFDIVM